MDQINGYNTFRDHEKNDPPPYRYKRVPVDFIFDVKFNLKRKARLVAGGHLTAQIHNDFAYAGIASIKSIRTCMFLSELNEMLL